MNIKAIASFICIAIIAPLFLLIPQLTHAHEVYVLKTGEIESAVNVLSPNPLMAVTENLPLFIKWGSGIVFLVFLALALSFWKKIQQPLSPYLLAIKKYAHLIERVTIGASLIASAYYQALFGPEIPFSIISPGWEAVLVVILYTAGILVIFGWLTRLVGITLGAIYIFTSTIVGIYLVSYLNYLGSAILLIIVGGGIWAVDKWLEKNNALTDPTITKESLAFKEKNREDLAFFILRVFYGSSLVFAAIYAKLLHSNLALKTIADYHLTNYFPFDPLFLVMGAFFVECVIGFFIIIGFEIRLATFVFTCFLTASIIFFGEAVWPHIVLFGLNVAVFVHGYDKYTLMKIFSKDELEPIL